MTPLPPGSLFTAPPPPPPPVPPVPPVLPPSPGPVGSPPSFPHPATASMTTRTPDISPGRRRFRSISDSEVHVGGGRREGGRHGVAKSERKGRQCRCQMSADWVCRCVTGGWQSGRRLLLADLGTESALGGPATGGTGLPFARVPPPRGHLIKRPAR